MEKVKKYLNGLKMDEKFTLIMVFLIMIPIIMLVSFFSYETNRGIISDSKDYMDYRSEQYRASIVNQCATISMVTQYFVKNDRLIDALAAVESGNGMTTDQLVDFKNSEVRALERLVNNNLSLYGVRVYAQNDQVLEMMPILYKHSRMKRQAWYSAEQSYGWKADYTDSIFDAYKDDASHELISYVSGIYDGENKQIGTVEAAMTMQSMFPALYETHADSYSCLITADGELILRGDNENSMMEDARQLYERLNQSSFTAASNQITKAVYEKVNGNSYVYAGFQVGDTGLYYMLVQDISDSISHQHMLRLFFIIALIVLSLYLGYATNHIVRGLLKKFYRIQETIEEVGAGNLDAQFDETGNDEMSELGGQINVMLARIRELMEENLDRELLMKNSEIKALQNQINAHFIYNVLESIKMMAEIDEKYDISDAITALGELLRYGMKWSKDNVTVEQELTYIDNYICLMNLRYDFSIQLAVNVSDKIREEKIPKMSLQPIVENAICHGIEELEQDATIYIKAVEQENEYRIEITDSGLGMNEELVDRLQKKINGEIEVIGGSGNGIGLKNVQDRIQLAFGKEYGIQVISKEGCYTKIVIYLPYTDRAQGLEAKDENITDCRG